MTTKLTDDVRRAMRNAAEVMEEQARSAETRLVGAETDPDCDEQTVSVLRREAAKWREPAEALRNALASHSSSGSGEREAVHGEDVAHACAHAHGMGQEDGFRAGVEAAAQIVAGWHIKRGGYLVLAEAIRALSSAPPPPDSGERVRVLEEALREARRCGDKLAKELRGWRDTYVSDDEEDPEGWLALDGWAKSSDARDRALSPQGDGTPEPKTKE